ncbi:2734_t:CDS:2, partial [Dentiscutata erythropus]
MWLPWALAQRHTLVQQSAIGEGAVLSTIKVNSSCFIDRAGSNLKELLVIKSIFSKERNGYGLFLGREALS